MTQKIDKSVLITSIIVIGAIILAVIGMNAFNPLGGKNTITANGVSSIKVLPDLVSVYLNIQTGGKTSEESLAKNSEMLDNLKTEFSNAGLDGSELKTQSFSAYPNYDWKDGSGKITGYTTVHSLKVEINSDETEKLGKIIDAGAASGAIVSSVNFELSQEKQNAYKAEAIKTAAADSKIKAETLS